MAKETNTLDDKSIAKLRNDHAEQKLELGRLKQLVMSLHKGCSDATPPPSVTRLFYNGSGETAPAFACMAVREDAPGRSALEPYLTITKPDTTFRRRYVVNGELPVAGDGWGYCYERGSVEVIYDSGEPAHGEGWGPKPDQWSVSRFYPETATVDVITDEAGKVMLANWKQITECWGEVAGNVTEGTTGNVTLMAGEFGSESSIGITLTGVGSPSSDLTLGDEVNVGWMNGQPEMYHRRCS